MRADVAEDFAPDKDFLRFQDDLEWRGEWIREWTAKGTKRYLHDGVEVSQDAVPKPLWISDKGYFGVG